MLVNNLSWLIFAADIVGPLKIVLLIVGIATVFILLIIAAIEENSTYIKYLLAPFIVILIGLLIPSKQAIYLIAASEFGEDVLETKTADKVFKIVDQYLDEQLPTNEENEGE